MDHDPVRWLYGLQHFGVKLGLDNIRALLDLLDHPEAAYSSALIAGTNGKGSVAAMLAAMLDASGRRSGLFTSPHLVRPNERIRIAGEDISTPDLHRHLESMRRRIERGRIDGALEVHPSFFEVITATALTVFRESAVDCAVLEVGLGGRLDATNAVSGRVSVVVSVALDHTKTLGPTLESIAGEKAGIIKPGRSVVTGVDQPEALAVLQRECRKAGSPLIEAGKLADLVIHEDGAFRISTKRAEYPGLRLSLPGRHQMRNARIAVVTFETLLEQFGDRADPEQARRGLASVRWPGRLQWVEADPPLLLDAAHNPAGATTLAEYLGDWLLFAKQKGACPPSHDSGSQQMLGTVKPVLLFGAMKGKDIEGILSPLAGLVESAVVTRPGVERAADPRDVADTTSAVLGSAERIDDPALALERARELARPDRYVLVAGSLYLVGQILGLLEEEPVPGPVSM